MRYNVWSEKEGGYYWARARCLFPNCSYSYSGSKPFGNPTDAEKSAKILAESHYGTHSKPTENKNNG